MKGLHMITFILLAVGGLNWLLVGLSSPVTLETLVGMSIAQILYVLVGISAIVEIALHKKTCKMCGSSAPMM